MTRRWKDSTRDVGWSYDWTRVLLFLVVVVFWGCVLYALDRWVF